jgi:predicted SAM-dependent methyltransferase
MKIQLGCGTNFLSGWINHDADVDITKTLPWEDESTDFLFIEHCVEHVGIQEAYKFFKEAIRILKKGGVLRVAVPSVVQIFKNQNDKYISFIQQHGWGKEGVEAITLQHGHQTWYTEEILEAVLGSLGFTVTVQKTGQSNFSELRGIDNHHKVIGHEFNEIESIVVDAQK